MGERLDAKNLSCFLEQTMCSGFAKSVHTRFVVYDDLLFDGDVSECLLHKGNTVYAIPFIEAVLTTGTGLAKNCALVTIVKEDLPVQKFYVSDNRCQVFLMERVQDALTFYSTDGFYRTDSLGACTFLDFDFERDELFSLVCGRRGIVLSADRLRLGWGWNEIVHWLDESLLITSELERIKRRHGWAHWRAVYDEQAKNLLNRAAILMTVSLYDYLTLYGEIDYKFTQSGGKSSVWFQKRKKYIL